MNRHLSRSAAALAATAAALVATPAAHASTPSGAFVIEQASVPMSATGAALSATATELVAGGRVGGFLHGTVSRTGTGPNCVWTRVTWKYADTSTSTTNSPRACTGEVSSRTVDLHARTDRDLVRYTIELRTAVDSVSNGTSVKTATWFVGPSGDSLGTAARIDRDLLSATRATSAGTAILFTGQADWAVADNPAASIAGPDRNIQGTVSGRLQWNDALPGTRALLYATWTYFDGSTQTVKLATIQRGGAPMTVEKTSNIFKDAKSVRLSIRSESDGASYGEQAGTATVKVGDYKTN